MILFCVVCYFWTAEINNSSDDKCLLQSNGQTLSRNLRFYRHERGTRHFRTIEELDTQPAISNRDHETGIPTGNLHFVSHSALIDSWCGLLTSKASPSIQSVLTILTISNSNVGEMEIKSEKKSIPREMRRSVQRRRKSQKRIVARFESVQFMRFLQRWMLITVSFR